MDASRVLNDAIRVLTEAATLTNPVLERISHSDGGHPTAKWVYSGRRAPADGAEFVTLALAGAAANAGGIEVVLADQERLAQLALDLEERLERLRLRDCRTTAVVSPPTLRSLQSGETHCECRR